MPDWITGLDRDSIERKVYADTLDNMGFDDSSQLSPEQNQKVEDYVDMLVEAQTGAFEGMYPGEDRDISWDGPLAQWLDLMDIRPIMEGVDVGMTGEE